jgi:nuclear transport factor 2 (NTF2) superfamily protein
VRAAEDAWNSRNPVRVSLGYTLDSKWRNRAEHLETREQIVAFLQRKWVRELDYRLIKEPWAFDGARINDLPITEATRKFRWPQGRRPDDDPGLGELGL